MDCHTVPFPSVSRLNDESSPERRGSDRAAHGRVSVKSSPSLPDWSVQFNHSGARPRLHPLDLARPSTPPRLSSKHLQPLSSPSVHSAQNSPLRESLLASARNASGSPQRLSTLLTPPLTPSSSFNSASTVATESDFGGDADMVPSTPPDGGSPLTWGKLRMKRPSIIDLGPADDVAADLTNGSVAELNDRMRAMDLTPRFEKKLVFGDLGEQDGRRAIEGDMGLDDEKRATRFLLVRHVPARFVVSDIRNALSRLGVTRIKGIVGLQPQNLILIVFYDLRDAIRSAVGLEGKTVSELNKNGVRLSSTLFPTPDQRKEDEAPLRVEYTDKHALEKVLENRPATIWDGTESTVFVEASSKDPNHSVDPTVVRNIMASVGPMVDFRPASFKAAQAVRTIRACSRSARESSYDSQVFFADYYDCENAATVRQQYNARTFLKATELRIFWASDLETSPERDFETEQAVQEQMPFPLLSYASLNGAPGVFDLASPPSSCLALPESPTPKRGDSHDSAIRHRRGSRQEHEGSPSRAAYDQGRIGSSTANPRHYGGLRFESLDGAPSSSYDKPYSGGERSADSLNFDYRGNLFDTAAAAPPNGQHYPLSASTYFPPQPLVTQHTGYQFPSPAPYQQFDPYSGPSPAGYGIHRDSSGWIYPSGSPSADLLSSAGNDTFGERTMRPGRHEGRKPSRPNRGGQHSDHAGRASSSSFGRSSSSSSFEGSFGSSMSTELAYGEGGVTDKGQVSEKNQLNIANIENGLDTRTTVMIKNIPNKMSDRDLMTFIDRVCPRRIDFLYLRMDFQNGCNVGYAFVNFITVQDLLLFAKTQLGVKWNMYSSEKVLQMSYANYQGKEALVEKFKNSCIMDEREAWRPKIFFSDGPNQGLPEPFPPPTHLRRKERSASNRGALFVPGAHHYIHGQGHRQPHQFHGSYRDQGFGPRF